MVGMTINKKQSVGISPMNTRYANLSKGGEYGNL